IENLADFVRKAQLANYEAFRAMYEGRNALLFHPTTAILTWMSNPAQPSFVWQLYHYDLEPNSSLFGVMHASEMVHIQFNQADGDLQVINNQPEPLPGLLAQVSIYNLDGSLAYEHQTRLTAAPEAATNLGPVAFPPSLSAVHFLKLDLRDAAGKLVSSNFYWRALPDHPDDYTELNLLPKVTLDAQATQTDENGNRTVTVTLHNPSRSIALMAHLQLRRKQSGERVLPVYYSDNYISLVPGETRTVTAEAAVSDFKGEDSLIVFDGWNVSVAPVETGDVSIAPNLEAQPGHWPPTGLPFQTTNLR
ncbi:MAG TPA: glycoside hydrolase family 2 protein, partial [Terracidiphilus sp.]|nr:glycoside hydrolase family 2 protein [Terracidiphilus sp.]